MSRLTVVFNASTNAIPSDPVPVINLPCILLNGFIWNRVGKKSLPIHSDAALKKCNEYENKKLGKGRFN